MRYLVRSAAIVVSMIAWMTFDAKTAEAHASLVASSPANDSRVAQSPREIRLQFSEPTVAELSHVDLVRIDGSVEMLRVTVDPHDVRTLVAQVNTLSAGAYRVVWHIISADGHPVEDTFVFTVGEGKFVAPPLHVMSHGSETDLFAGEPMIAGAAVLPAILRGLALCALLVLAGLLAFESFGSGEKSARVLRVCSVLSVVATIFFAAHLLAWLKHVSPEQSVDVDFATAALSRSVGATELARLLLTLLSAWSLLLVRRPRLALFFASAAVIVGGAIGHPAAIHPLIAIPATALHLVAVAAWLGGIAWLAITLSDSSVSARAEKVSAVALVSVCAVTITGIIQAILFLNTPSDLIRSDYGLIILAKFAGLAVLICFGAYHRYRVLPSLAKGGGSRKFGRSLKLEIGVMLIVTMLGGFLAYVPTPHAMRDMHGMTSHTSAP